MKYTIAALLSFTSLLHLSGQDLIPIAEIQGEAETSPMIDQEVTFNAKVTEYFGDFWFMQDDFGAWNGVMVLEADLLVPANPPWWNEPRQPEVGDELTITGTVYEIDGNTQIMDAVLVEQTEFWLATPSGTQVDCAGTQDESLEGTRVRVMSATVTVAADSNDEWVINDGTGDVTVIGIDDEAIPAVGDIYDVYGAIREFNGVYKIQLGDIDVVALNILERDDHQLELFPNPSNGIFRLKAPELMRGYDIHDLEGRAIISETVNAKECSIKCSHLPSGIYTIRIQFENGLSNSERLIIH